MPEEQLSLETEVKEPVAAPEVKAEPEGEGTEAAPKDEKETQAPDERKFTQAELDEIVQKERAKAERRAERHALKAHREMLDETLRRVLPAQPQPVDGKPAREQYTSEDQFLEALTDWKIDQRDARSRQEAQRYEHQSLAEKTESIYAKAEKLPGFDREAFDELDLTQAIAQTLVEAEAPEKIMAFLVLNPEEVDRIKRLSPTRQAAEMGKLEAKLSSAPRTSNAPPPIKPVGSRGGASHGDPSQMSQAEYEASRTKQGAWWGAKRNST